jgi:hypothetical protein
MIQTQKLNKYPSNADFNPTKRQPRDCHFEHCATETSDTQREQDCSFKWSHFFPLEILTSNKWHTTGSASSRHWFISLSFLWTAPSSATSSSDHPFNFFNTECLTQSKSRHRDEATFYPNRLLFSSTKGTDATYKTSPSSDSSHHIGQAYLPKWTKMRRNINRWTETSLVTIQSMIKIPISIHPNLKKKYLSDDCLVGCCAV